MVEEQEVVKEEAEGKEEVAEVTEEAELKEIQLLKAKLQKAKREDIEVEVVEAVEDEEELLMKKVMNMLEAVDMKEEAEVKKVMKVEVVLEVKEEAEVMDLAEEDLTGPRLKLKEKRVSKESRKKEYTTRNLITTKETRDNNGISMIGKTALEEVKTCPREVTEEEM